MFRKIFGVSALICAAVLVGCSSGKDEPTAVEPETPAPTEEVTEAPSEEETEPTVRTRVISSIEDFDYEIFEGHAVITSYTGSESEIVIPPEIEGAPVTEIGFYAFEAKYGVTSVELPDSLEIIGQFAFMDCADLQTINIPEKVKEIQRGAFASCTSLGPVVIPKKTAVIREEAFTACESMETLTINNPDLKYENWGLEDLPELTIRAAEGSAVYKWAEEKGFTVEPV